MRRAVISAVLLVGACTDSGDEAESTSSTTTSTTEAPASVVTLKDATLSFEGLGPIRVGQLVTGVNSQTGLEIPDFECGIDGIPGVASDVTVVSDSSGMIARVDVYESGSPGPKLGVQTNEGIGLGTSEADLRAAYGDELQSLDPESESSNLVVANAAGDRALAFTVSDGKVIWMRAGTTEALQQMGACA